MPFRRAVRICFRACRKEKIVAVFNFSGAEQSGYQLEIPGAVKLERIFSSELPAYGGKGGGKFRALPDKTSSGNRAFEFTLASFSAEYYLIL